MKNRHLLIILAFLATSFSSFLATPTFALSDDQRGAISQNCGTIKQSLKRLQRVDSRTRVYLGTSYETILSSFLNPLVARLDKNSLSDHGLRAIASEFNFTRNDFASTFTNYQKTLEKLVSYDCQSDPDGFYTLLESARSERANLNQTTIQLRALISQQTTTVKNLKGEL